jgi:hypothetical protein
LTLSLASAITFLIWTTHSPPVKWHTSWVKQFKSHLWPLDPANKGPMLIPSSVTTYQFIWH